MRTLASLVIMLCLMTSAGFAQNTDGVSINNTGAAPDSSAILDVSSVDKGVLIPRTDTNTVNASGVGLADGLLIYQDTDSTFYYYDGILWRGMGSGGTPTVTTGDTYTTVGGTAAMTTTGAWQVIPGLSQTITVPAGHQVMLSTYGIFTCAGAANTYSLVDISFYIDGILFRTYGYDGGYLRIGAENNAVTNIPEPFSMTEVITIPPGTYTFDVQAVNEASSPNNSNLSGNSGSAFQATFTVGLIRN